ncbi:MAG: DUF559 domain-containing protein [Desulfobulbaceae bacterium]|nr:DUF559 domain-containing protein [Desulfobulbaceae bacterium]
MSLFQKSVEKKYLNELDSTLIDVKYSAFMEYFGNKLIQLNIKSAKEEQFQEGFLRELFVKILGYTLQPEPDYNLISEYKNITNSRKADGAILRGDEALAVIELKSLSTTDLDTIESQAFGYKNHHPKCIYVITSNFGKLRFYIQNAVDYIDFDLFNLSRNQFSLLWLCLGKDNLLNDVPLKIKESSLLQEEDITKKLYADYSKFRNAIYNNLIKNNPELDKLLLFKKTQKLLDRFLFVFFAEDRLLLPPNSIREIINHWETLRDVLDEYVPLYDRFKKYFGYLNTGYKNKHMEVFAYNGGLFAEDEILDNITIDDEILYSHTLKLSQYDFDTEVDVNILGHIFEHSLGEIENVQAEIMGEKVETQKSKRKKDGIYYTPKYITKYIVENTVGKLCAEKRVQFGINPEDYAIERTKKDKNIIIALDAKITNYRNWLLTITILDPACGSGAFLNQALEFLIEEHRKLDELRALLFGGGLVFADITTDILENNIFGVDINEESVEIAKLSLWLRTAQKGRKLNTLTSNIKCGNSLIDDPEVAGEKAFDWAKEFPQVFKVKKSYPPNPLKKGELNRYLGEIPLSKGELKGDSYNLNSKLSAYPKIDEKSYPPNPLKKGELNQEMGEIPLSKGELKGDSYNSNSKSGAYPKIDEKSYPPNPLSKGELNQNMDEFDEDMDEIPLPKGELNHEMGEIPLSKGELNKNMDEFDEDMDEIPLPKGELNHDMGEIPLSKGELKGDSYAHMKDWIIKRGLLYSQYYLPYNPKLIDRAKELRKNMTAPEKKLWYHFLHDFKFRVLRQRTIDNYIVDFYIAEVKLAIEIDGDSHFSDEGLEYDSVRSEILNHYGIKVIRFNNLEVMNSFEGVCNSIMDEVDRLYLLINKDNAQADAQINDKLEYSGGFDVVIGNPPYVTNIDNKDISIQSDYLSLKYNLQKNQLDLYLLFTKLSFDLLSLNGTLGLIIPNSWINNLTLVNFRTSILSEHTINDLVILPMGVFEGIKVDNSIIIAKKLYVENNIIQTSELINNNITKSSEIIQDNIKEHGDFQLFQNDSTKKLIEKVNQNSIKLNSICNLYSGLKEYEIGKGIPKQTSSDVINKVFNSNYKISDDYLKHLSGNNIKRYQIDWMNEYIKYGEWLAAPRKKDIFIGDRIIIREIPDTRGIIATFVSDDYTTKNTAHVCKLISEDSNYDYRFILTILNSTLLGYYFKFNFSEFDNVFPKAKLGQCKELPIPNISPEAQVPFIELADIMLEKNKELQDVKNKFLDLLKADFSIEKLSTKLQNWYELSWADFTAELRKLKIELKGVHKEDWSERLTRMTSKAQEIKAIINQTDRTIDQLVYQLYELSDEEIRIVEGE